MNSDKLSITWKDKTFELRRGTIILLDRPNTEILASGFDGRGMVVENCMFGGLVMDVYPNIHAVLVYFIGIEKGKAAIENLASFGVTIVYNDGDKWLITPDMIKDVFLRKPVPLVDQHGELIRRLEPTKQFTSKLTTSTINKFLPVVGSNERLISFSYWPTPALRSLCNVSNILDPVTDKALARKFFPDAEDITIIQKAIAVRKVAERRAAKNKNTKKYGYSFKAQYYGGTVEPAEPAEPAGHETGLHNLPFVPSEAEIVEETPGGPMFRHQIGRVAGFGAVNLSGDVYTFPISELEGFLNLTKQSDRDVVALIMKPGTILCLNEKPDIMIVDGSILNGDYPNVANSLATIKLSGPNGSYYELMAVSFFHMNSLDPAPASRFKYEVDKYIATKFPQQYQSAVAELGIGTRGEARTSGQLRMGDILNAIGTNPLAITEEHVSYPADGEIVINTDDYFSSTILNAVEDGASVKITSNSSSAYSGVMAEYYAVSDNFFTEYSIPSVVIKFKRDNSNLCGSKFITATAKNKANLAEYFYRNQDRIPSGILRTIRRSTAHAPRTSAYIARPTPRVETEAIHVYTTCVKISERDAVITFDYDQLGPTISKSVVRNNTVFEVTDRNGNALSRWQIKDHGYFLWGVQFESSSGQLMPPELAGKMAQRLEVMEENPQEVIMPAQVSASADVRRSLTVLQNNISFRSNIREINLHCENIHRDELDKLAYYGTEIRIVNNGDHVLRRYMVIQPRFSSWRLRLKSSDPGYHVPPDLREIYVEERSVERDDVPIGGRVDIQRTRSPEEEYRSAYSSYYINGNWERAVEPQRIVVPNIQNAPAPATLAVDTDMIFTESNADSFWRQNQQAGAVHIVEESAETGEMIISATIGAVDYKIVPDHFKIISAGGEYTVDGHLNVEYKLSSGIGATINARITWSPTKGWYYTETAPGMLVKANNTQLNDFLNDLFHVENVAAIPLTSAELGEYTGEEEG